MHERVFVTQLSDGGQIAFSIVNCLAVSNSQLIYSVLRSRLHPIQYGEQNSFSMGQIPPYEPRREKKLSIEYAKTKTQISNRATDQAHLFSQQK